MANAQDILDFWFEGVGDAVPVEKNANPFKKWFARNEKFDQQIRGRFEADLMKARRGDYKDWEAGPGGRLALILLFDQFSRNMYRGTPQMYAADAPALDLTLRSIKEKIDQRLALIERVFFYLPLEHAENLKMQQLCLQYFEDLVRESREKYPHNTAYYQ